MRLSKLAGLCVLLLAGCAGGGSSSSLPSLGTQFSGSMKIGHQQVPLPPGQWFVRGSSEAYTAIGSSGAALPPTNFIVLVNQAPENPYFIFVRSIADGQFGWKASRSCSPKNSLHSETRINQDVGDQDCWWIKKANIRRRSVRNLSSNKQSHYYESAKQVSEWARGAGVTFPVRSFVVGYHMADIRDVFGVEYFFDPEQDHGPVPASGTASYIDRLTEWGAGWSADVKAGFDGKLQKSVHRPRNKTITQPATSNTEIRLKRLDNLLNKKLITPDEYKAHRKIIIEQL